MECGKGKRPQGIVKGEQQNIKKGILRTSAQERNLALVCLLSVI
jgi:hypothetical protein